MKSHTEYLWFNTKQKTEFINITAQIEKIVEKAGIKEGFCLVSAMHTTAGIWVNDAESGLLQDIKEWAEKLVPFKDYMHNLTGEDNGHAHIKKLLIGHQEILPITKGKLDFGPWEQVFYAEFDGQRKKRAIVKIIGE